jgi:hypothetical protein
MMITGIVRADIDAVDDCDGDESARQEMIADNDADVVAETAKAARREIQHADIDVDDDDGNVKAARRGLTTLTLTPSTKSCKTGIHHADIDAVDDDDALKKLRNGN